jgi:hypothetical protein
VLKRDPEDGKPIPEKWEVTFVVTRTVAIEGVTTAAAAEEKARDEVLFADEFPIDREEITRTNVGWVNPEPEADQGVVHLEGCWGNHCHHYDCDIGDGAIDHRAYCTQCDIESY